MASIVTQYLYVDRKEAGYQNNYSDKLDICAADDDIEAMTGLLSFALRSSDHYSKLLLSHIKPDSNCVRAARALRLCRDIDEVFAPSNSLPYAFLDLTRGDDEYLSSLSRKFRLNLNRMRNKAQKEGIEVRELGPENLAPESLPGLFL